MADDLNVTSASAAFARQARTERAVELALENVLRVFLEDVYGAARTGRDAVSPAAVAEAWAHYTSADTLAERLPREVAEYVAAGLAESTVPDETYTSVMSVYQRSAEQAWSLRETRDALQAALSPDGGATFLVPVESLVAAAPIVKRDAEGRPKYRRTAGLDVGGMSWINRMRQEARTSVTGLDGILSTDAMRRQGKPFKMWVTRRDERVRHTHNVADGQTVPVDDTFTVGGFPMRHPGDRTAPASETINCRCVTVGTDHEVRGSTDLTFLSPA